MTKIAFMASGNGTNAENLIREIHAGRIPGEAVVVICDKPGAEIFERAARLGVEGVLVDRKAFPDKTSFEAVLTHELEQRQIEMVVLAGFMRILSDSFVKKYLGKIINIHPSYLPDFKGAHAIRDAYAAKASETGVTVHFVEPEVDDGPVILQRKISIEAADDLGSLEKKIHCMEYEIYPEALRKVLSGEVKYP